MKKSFLILLVGVSFSLNTFASEADFKSGQCMGTTAVLMKKTDDAKIGVSLKNYWNKNQPYLKSIGDKVGACMNGRQDGASHTACANQLPPAQLDFYKGFNAVLKEAASNNYSQDYLYKIPLLYCMGVAG